MPLKNPKNGRRPSMDHTLTHQLAPAKTLPPDLARVKLYPTLKQPNSTNRQKLSSHKLDLIQVLSQQSSKSYRYDLAFSSGWYTRIKRSVVPNYRGHLSLSSRPAQYMSQHDSFQRGVAFG